MQNAGVQALILPSADPHQSEYVAERWKSRQFFSGFSGSAGTAVITQDGGGVWTDSRYYVSAKAELAKTSGLQMMKSAQGSAEYVEWLAAQLPKGSVVGIDGQLFTVDQVKSIRKRFRKTQLSLRTDVDLIDEAWPQRPGMPSSKIFSHEIKYTGRSIDEKLASLRAKMKKDGLSHTFLSALDEIAWLLNMRASDIECNPLAIAFALVGHEKVQLFTAPDRVDETTQTAFGASDVEVLAYAEHEKALQQLPKEAKVGIDPSQVNDFLAGLLSEDQYSAWPSPIRHEKALKNPTEVEHMRRAHVKDGVALVRAFRWLEHELRERTVRECEFVDVLGRERAKQDLYFGNSFSAIVAYGANAALPHYHSIPGEDAEIRPEGILLVDSGGQYLDGTTDITRTFGLGKVSDEMRTRYTLVLKGMIALSQAVFPKGTRGLQLDSLARQFLWQQGLDFGHGTGHGVGFFLNVHESPQGFAPNMSERGQTGYEAGMFSSNEPGFYKEGEYGIRIENLVLAIPAFPQDEVAEGEKEFLRFETITYYPIDVLLLEPDLLTPAEREWLNAYHEQVYKRLSPKLDKDERKWLKVRTERL